MFGGSRRTLLLFVWVFYIGGGLFGLWDIYSFIRDGNDFALLHVLLIPLDAVLLIGGLYFVFKLDSLLPSYCTQVVRAFTAIFIIDTLVGLLYIPQTLSDPEAMSQFGGNPWAWIVGLTVVGIAFNYLIYLIVVSSIKKVSGIETKQSQKMTWIYWAIVLAFFATMLILMLWDPNTNSFNVL